MILRAKKDKNYLFFELEGHLDFDTNQKFEETCQDLIQKTEEARVVFNLEKLKFVGSTGINHFIKILKDFNSLGEKPRYCHLSSEFEKIFRAFETTRRPFQIFNNVDQAIESFDAPTAAPKKNPLKRKPANPQTKKFRK